MDRNSVWYFRGLGYIDRSSFSAGDRQRPGAIRILSGSYVVRKTGDLFDLVTRIRHERDRGGCLHAGSLADPLHAVSLLKAVARADGVLRGVHDLDREEFPAAVLAAADGSAVVVDLAVIGFHGPVFEIQHDAVCGV